MRARETGSGKWFVYSSGIFLYFPFFSELDVGLESVQMAKCHHQQKRQLFESGCKAGCLHDDAARQRLDEIQI